MTQNMLTGSVPVIPLDQIPDAVGLGNTLNGESFSANQWTGFTDLSDILDKNGNYVAFSPMPEGIVGLVGAALIASFFRRLASTEKGQAQIVSVINKYLDTTGDILETLHDVNGANAFVALFQNRTAVPIYRRLGLMTPKEATQLEAWLDHCLGEMLKKDYVGLAVDALKGAETLVKGSSYKKGDVKGEYEGGSGLVSLLNAAGLKALR